MLVLFPLLFPLPFGIPLGEWWTPLPLMFTGEGTLGGRFIGGGDATVFLALGLETEKGTLLSCN